jgi:protein-S-isoprenylcysteine O-methyltransferase Ste14
LNLHPIYLPVATVAAIWLERMREVRAKRDTVPGRRQEGMTFALFMLAGGIMFAGGIAEALVFRRPPNWWLFAVGVVLAVASFVLRRRTIAALGRFWSLHVEMREGHEFVRSGPFRWMRHPVYFSMILELLGPALILGAWRAFALAAAIFIPTLWWRLRIEEAALVEKFGAAYVEYRRATPMLFPWRWPQS